MKVTAWALVLVLMGGEGSIAASPPRAAEQSLEAEGRKVIAAGSINPPDPVDSCSQAKTDARTKANAAGFKGRVEWIRLSNDNDCHLDTPGARGVGYFYIFTAKGKFYK